MIQLLLSLAVSAPASMAGASTCKKLDYDSYFIAQNAKSNLQKLNPDVTHPNFSGKYLLLKNEMMMETLYLIADCETGKFFHEKLNGPLEFSLASNQVVLRHPKEDPETQIWDGSHWLKIETPPSVIQTSTLSTTSLSTSTVASTTVYRPILPPLDVLSAYDALFKNYPVPAPLPSCHPIDFDSSFRAQTSKGSMIKSNGDLTKPNFAGNYLLLKDELMFDTLYLLADCKTGKFIGEPLKDNAKFQLGSTFVLVKDSNHYPRLYVLNRGQWIQIPDPVQNKSTIIKNTLYHQDAELLFHALPNPQHLQNLHFENLEKKPELESLFNLLGVGKISSGECSQNQKTFTCEIQTE